MPNFNLQAVMPMETVLPFLDQIRGGDSQVSQDSIRAETDILHYVICPALKVLLKAKAAEGALRKIPNGDGHEILFVNSWNKVCDGEFGLGKTDWPDKHLDVSVLGMVNGYEGLLLPMLEAVQYKRPVRTRKYAYKELIKAMEAGKFTARHDICKQDGLIYRFTSENWNPVGECLSRGNEPMRPLPPKAGNVSNPHCPAGLKL